MLEMIHLKFISFKRYYISKLIKSAYDEDLDTAFKKRNNTLIELLWINQVQKI